MKNLIKKILGKIGIQVKRYPDEDLKRRMKIISHFKIDTLFDIGANTGQYGRKMRELGYRGRIVSFEPVASSFEALKKTSTSDNNWTVNKYALGKENSKSIINISENSYSSSILNLLPTHLESAPQSKYVTQEEIEIKKIDSIFASFYNNEDKVMLKIDTQGFEKNVLEGASMSLSNIKIIQLEMSIIPLYENEMLFNKMIDYLSHKEFQLYSLENGFSDSTTGQLLQVDGIFTKKLH